MTPEKKFENETKDYLRQHGCYVAKIWGGGFQASGIPDLFVCAPNGKFIAIEVKSEHGRPSELQKWHISQINEAGGWGLILYPNQFDEFKNDFLKFIE